MQKEYKESKGKALFVYITSPILLALFIWIIIILFEEGGISTMRFFVTIPYVIVGITFIIFSVIKTIKNKIIITDDRIISINMFSKKELKFNEIMGFKGNHSYIFVIPYDSKLKTINISKSLSGHVEIYEWLSKEFSDIDSINAINETQEILNDKTKGWRKEINEEKLKLAKRVAKTIERFSMVATCWVVFYPKPYELSILITLAIPIIAILAIRLSNGFIRLTESEGNVYPTIFYAFLFPAIGLFIRINREYDILEYTNIFEPMILITLTLLTVLLLSNKDYKLKTKSDFLVFFLLSFFIFMYSFSVVIFNNCFYDHSEPDKYKANVINKNTEHVKFYLLFNIELSTNLKHNYGHDNIYVSSETYKSINIGDDVVVNLNKGSFNIPWLTVTIVKNKPTIQIN